MIEEVKKLYELIINAKNCVILTGAGISTLSGIRDFRSEDGLYSEYNVEEIFNIGYFMLDPTMFWQYAKNFDISKYEPNVVHNVITKLQQKGLVKQIITQNIDRLHQKSGSADILEAHGSFDNYYCTRCSQIPVFTNDSAFIMSIVNNDLTPVCSSCGGLIKPGITFFGECMPESFTQITEVINNCDLLICLGTSLEVFPIANLPGVVLENKGKIVIVNKQKTRYDRYATVKLDDLKSTFEELDVILS